MVQRKLIALLEDFNFKFLSQIAVLTQCHTSQPGQRILVTWPTPANQSTVFWSRDAHQPIIKALITSVWDLYNWNSVHMLFRRIMNLIYKICGGSSPRPIRVLIKILLSYDKIVVLRRNCCTTKRVKSLVANKFKKGLNLSWKSLCWSSWSII